MHMGLIDKIVLFSASLARYYGGPSSLEFLSPSYGQYYVLADGCIVSPVGPCSLQQAFSSEFFSACRLRELNLRHGRHRKS